VTPFSATVPFESKELLRRAVQTARPRGLSRSPRWVAVMQLFLVGSTTAGELCRAFDLDPDEMLLPKVGLGEGIFLHCPECDRFVEDDNGSYVAEGIDECPGCKADLEYRLDFGD